MPDGIQRPIFPDDPDRLASAGRRFNKTKNVVGTYVVGGDRSRDLRENDLTNTNTRDDQLQQSATARDALAWLARNRYGGIRQLVQDVGMDRVVYEVEVMQERLGNPSHGIRNPMG